jgi:endothelin-converting enzyme/putative endopeptidase
MSPETKQQALLKLRAISNKIGYPDSWQDYNGLVVGRADALANTYRAAELESERAVGKIGKPVDRGEWGMTVATVNASYYTLQNTVTFPAGILQPPFYDKSRDDAVNFGGIGAVIGHELTHGFDDIGRKFDADGNLRDWWTAGDAKEFEKRASCLVDQYAAFSPVDGVKLNGRLTLGENTADNGGVRIALMALLDRLGEKSREKVDGFTAEQRFFLGFAGVWCETMTEQTARMLATIDPHSPGRFRVNGVLSNMPEFQKAFSCRVDQPMVRGPACRVW